MSWNPFKKKAKSEIAKNSDNFDVVPLKPMNYSAMVILAWAKAIDGDLTLQDWLRDNGYKELYIAIFAIHLKDNARDWLIENGYAHLMAMIDAAESNDNAAKWLLHHKFETLYHIAKAVDYHDESWVWLRTYSTEDIFILAQAIKKVKDEIEENHNDPHWIHRDF